MQIVTNNQKDQAIEALKSLPEDANVEDMMYRLYVLDKIRKALQELENGEVLGVEELQREIEAW